MTFQSPGQTEIVFSSLKDVNLPEFKSALQIYANAFPVNERHRDQVIYHRVAQGLNNLIVGKKGGRVVFIALLWPLKRTRFVLLDYMATDPAFRGQGIAKEFLASQLRLLTLSCQYFLIEVEDPRSGSNRSEREKRIQFYIDNGAVIISDLPYILPALQGHEPTDMWLMIFPSPIEPIPGSEMKQVIIQVYRELYQQDAPESVLSNPILHSPIPLKFRKHQ